MLALSLRQIHGPPREDGAPQGRPLLTVPFRDGRKSGLRSLLFVYNTWRYLAPPTGPMLPRRASLTYRDKQSSVDGGRERCCASLLASAALVLAEGNSRAG